MSEEMKITDNMNTENVVEDEKTVVEEACSEE